MEMMTIGQLLDEQVLLEFFKDVVTVGLLPGFMLTTVLEFLGYAIFRTLGILNIRV